MECRHRFPNGKRCRCRATTAHVFCQHHAPQPRVPTLRNREVPFTDWLDLRRALPTLDRSEIPPAILYVLSALLEEHPRPISDRSAGALLRDLLHRCGSVPFTLPHDPAPDPDYAFALSQSIDRIAEIIQRRSAYPSAQPIHPGLLINQEMSNTLLPGVRQATPWRSPAESIPIPHHNPAGRGSA